MQASEETVNTPPTAAPTPRPGLILIDRDAMQAQYRLDVHLAGAAGIGIGIGAVTALAVIGGLLYYRGVVQVATTAKKLKK